MVRTQVGTVGRGGASALAMLRIRLYHGGGEGGGGEEGGGDAY